MRRLFYENFVTFTSQSDEQLYANCPFHPDDTPSFTVNSATNQWFCHGCHQGGSEVQFVMQYYDVSQKIAEFAYTQWEKTGILPFPTEDYIEKLHQNLLKRPSEVTVLNEMGITDETIEQYKLGWEEFRINIPVYSRRGFCINIRKYLPPHRRSELGKDKKVIQIKGLGDTRFYPYDAFNQEEIYIVEGEKDCLVARSHGLNAITGTGGSNVPMKEMGLFKDKFVYVMVDSDTVGDVIRKDYNKLLHGIAKKVTDIRLPVKDFADYWKDNQNIEILQFVIAVTQEQKEEQTQIDESLLSKSENVSYLNTWIRLENMCIVGVDPKTYSIPTKLKAVCHGSPDCKKLCSVAVTTDPMIVDIDPRQILQFIDSADTAQDNFLRQFFHCKNVSAEPVEFINVQKFIFQETASFIEGLEDSSFEHRYGVYMYDDERLMPTKHYSFEASRVTDPRNQQNYYVIRKAEIEGLTEIETDPDDIAYFRTLSDNCTSATELLNLHYEIWKSALGIEGRLDLFSVVMLTYLSATEINWKGGTLKGWLDTMVIGDTRTGKSQLAQRIVKTLKLGSYINGENGKRTGVIGGIQHFGDSWVITWGAIPMNDKGLLIIDEASGLSVEDIKELSATRSSGAVTINKIAKGEAKARTRLLWFSNARSGKNLEDFYWKGYGAFLEFIPIVEDQARFDVVISAAREDIEVLQGIKFSKEPPVELWRNLIMFMWTINKDLITITPEATAKVASTSVQLEDLYGGGPLVIGVAVHEKLIRLSCAFAALRGSIMEDILVVTEKDVDYAAEFLVSTYAKKSFDYKTFVTEHRKALKRKQENTDFIKAQCILHPALRVLLASNVFRGGQVREVLGLDLTETSKLISALLQRGLLSITSSGAYQPDKMLINIVKEMSAD